MSDTTAGRPTDRDRCSQLLGPERRQCVLDLGHSEPHHLGQSAALAPEVQESIDLTPIVEEVWEAVMLKMADPIIQRYHIRKGIKDAVDLARPAIARIAQEAEAVANMEDAAKDTSEQGHVSGEQLQRQYDEPSKPMNPTDRVEAMGAVEALVRKMESTPSYWPDADARAIDAEIAELREQRDAAEANAAHDRKRAHDAEAREKVLRELDWGEAEQLI